MLQVSIERNFESWRDAARSLLERSVEPADVLWNDDSSSALLLGERSAAIPASAHSAICIPRSFVEIARLAACHRDVERWPLLYRLAWRLTHGEKQLLDISVDDDVRRLDEMHRAVRRDRHKMTAFVRFRRIEGSDEQFVAWHQPDHFIVRLTTPFFVNRFAAMRWSILTPDESVSWDGVEARFAPGVPASQAPKGDELEDLWRTYYANIFNPARVNVRAMKREMPVRHWKTLPETAMIPELLKQAPSRVEAMVAKQRRTISRVATGGSGSIDCPTATSAAEFVPASRQLPVLAKAATACKGCSLYCNATQVVFGEGPRDATVMFVGEQPGDQEDLAGKPFVGPSGKLLDDMMQQAGVPREAVYVTNAVKHFKFEPRGTRRIHSKPSAREVGACRPWLEAEIEAVKPSMIVCLGATAAQSLMGSGFRVTQQRGQGITDTKWAPWVMATVHPSSLLRVPDPSMREEAYALFLSDMKKVAKQLKAHTARS
jgi:probable DNA metabolism protein